MDLVRGMTALCMKVRDIGFKDGKAPGADSIPISIIKHSTLLTLLTLNY